MDLPNVILGFLSWKPFSGYDLKRIISDSGVFYWSGNNNQIYKSLLGLQRAGLVTHQVQIQENLPSKKIYSITEKGRKALYENLLAQPELPEVRKNFLVQLAWTEMLPDQEIIALLDRYEAELSLQLQMQSSRAGSVAESPRRSSREIYLWERISTNLASTYQMELDWVRQTKQGIQEKQY